MTVKQRWLTLLLCLFTAMLLASCGGSAPPKAQETKKVSLAMLRLTSSAPIFIGIEQGFFRAEGIEIEPQWFEAAHPIAVATAADKVDIGATGITASLFNLVAGGQSLTIVADKGREERGYSSSALMVTSELWDKGIRRPEDLRGKRVGITQTGSTYHYMLGRILEANGLSLKDVEVVPLTKISALMAALQSRQLDAVILNEPNISRATADGYGKVLVQVGDIMDYQTSGVFFSPRFAKDRDLAVRFLKGYVRSVRYYHDAVLTRPAGQHYEEVVRIVAKYTGAPAEEVRQGLPYMDRDGRLLASDIQTQINWYKSQKMIEKAIDAGQVTNTALLEEAIRGVGP